MSLITDALGDDRELNRAFHQLHAGPASAGPSSYDAECLRIHTTLVALGLACQHTEGGYHLFTLTEAGRDLHQRNEAARLPVEVALARAGITPKDLNNLQRTLKRSPSLAQASANRRYPKVTKEWAAHNYGSTLVTNEDGQFSSAQLTREYVAEFCQLNSLTR